MTATSRRASFRRASRRASQQILKEAEGREVGPGIKLNPLEVEATDDGREYKYVSLKCNREGRYADLTVRAPEGEQPTTAEEIQKLGDAYWPLRAYRELDDALLHLRMNEPEIGLVCCAPRATSTTCSPWTRRWSRTATTGSSARSSSTWRACCAVST